MKYIVDNSNDPIEFPYWGGALSTIADIKKAGKEDAFNAHMEELFASSVLDANGYPELWTDSEINDYVWHSRDAVYAAVGLDENGEIPADVLTLEVDHRPMTEAEALQLKEALFYGNDKTDCDIYDYESPDEIPNAVLNATYAGVNFGEEDFFCNLK